MSASLKRDPRPDPTTPLPPLRFEAIYAAFRRIAGQHPNRTALVHRDAWTYGELDNLSSGLAAKLVADRVAPGDVLAVVCDRDPSFVCGMLATLKAGAAFVMINDTYPAARIATCLTLARPRHVLVAGRMKSIPRFWRPAAKFRLTRASVRGSRAHGPG